MTEIESSTPAVAGLAPQDGANQALGTAILDPDLREAIRRLARTGHLLVASDYDGTLAPIVANPNQALPLPGSVTLMRELAELPSTSVAVISGRALRDLAAMSRLPIEIQLVGSHGAEFSLESFADLGTAGEHLLNRIRAACQSEADRAPGVHLEMKPAGVTVHVRQASFRDAQMVVRELSESVAEWPGVYTKHGKQVIEFSVVRADKGAAIERLRRECDATATLFIGDDVTDESAFARLEHDDVGVKVGPGTTMAGYRVRDTESVLSLLECLIAERHSWLAGADSVPIEDHALLSDGIDVALLTPSGVLTWLCYPGPDAAAVFADLLGDPEAGHLTLRPVRGGRPLSQRYVEKTMTVVTKWAGVTVTDYLDASIRGESGGPLHLVRSVTNSAPVRVTFAPRPQFGSVPVRLAIDKHGVRVIGSADPIGLVAPDLLWNISRSGPHETATAVIEPSDTPAVLELRIGSDDLRPDPRSEDHRRALTEAMWQRFVKGLTLPRHMSRDESAAVTRSALTLKGLCHRPTGAVLAAATTSLPEWVGGIRNWDYRYCWLRDGAMTVHALTLLGSTAEADEFMSWLLDVFSLAPSSGRIHPLYSLDGSILGPEAVVDTLPGYAGSRPVRIGNAAQGQVQLDVFGPICALIADVAARRGLTGMDLELATKCVDAVRRRWHEPDHGVWEIRSETRHHVHSRVMCWLAVDSAVRIHHLARATKPEWEHLRDEIAEDIMTNGFDPELGTFVSAYGRRDVDAGVLSVVTSGLLPGDDVRVISTIRAVEEVLRDGPTVYRYRHDDGLPGTEGGMHLCTSWLIEAYAAAGMLDEAENLFAQFIACSGSTGLLPEMFDPGTKRGLGNHPQAYSHLGLIRAALLLDVARSSSPDWNRVRAF
ncbi:MAG: trehalose-phosphatase [Candidatus Nanopelagicales bacterium]|nr:trehalose-phosphatase [Candidatus Nanopelagicales bacterium]